MGRVSSSRTPQRIGLIGDIHTESSILEAALRFLQDAECDLLLCVGDVVDGPEEVLGTERCCELLHQHEVLTVCGNHDRWMLEGVMRDLPDAIDRYELAPEAIDYLESLPATRVLTTPDGPLLLCHGLGEDDTAALMPASPQLLHQHAQIALQQLLDGHRYRFVVNGHSHQRLVHAVEGTLFINAGTLHRDFEQICALVDFAQREIVYYSMASPGDIKPIERFRLPCPTTLV